jgi:HlyD family secretion protein
VQLSAQRASLLDLEQRRSDEGQRGLVTLRNAYHALRAAVAAWKQDNLLVAPVDGTVSYFRDLHENQFAAASEPLVAVVPTAAGLVGRVSLTGMGAGKVRPGQRVIIRFESYPYREYGTVEGRVRRVSQLGFQADVRAAPDVTTYQVEVTLPKGLVTSYGRRLEFRQEMRGDADVVTQDMRLIERVFNKVRSTGGGG